jgi:hypothetical protein
MSTQISPMLAVATQRRRRLYKKAFGATELWRVEAGGDVVAGLSVSGAEPFLAQETPSRGTRAPDAVGHRTERIEYTNQGWGPVLSGGCSRARSSIPLGSIGCLARC